MWLRDKEKWFGADALRGPDQEEGDASSQESARMTLGYPRGGMKLLKFSAIETPYRGPYRRGYPLAATD